MGDPITMRDLEGALPEARDARAAEEGKADVGTAPTIGTWWASPPAIWAGACAPKGMRKGMRIHDVAHQWLLDEERRGVYTCFAKFHAIMVDADARKIYDPCFPTSMALSAEAICKYPLTEKCWRLS